MDDTYATLARRLPDLGCSVVSPLSADEGPEGFARLLHAPRRPMQGGSGGVLPRSGIRNGTSAVASESMKCGCKFHTPAAVSVLAHDQLQWQGAPVPFSQEAECGSHLWSAADDHVITLVPSAVLSVRHCIKYGGPSR